MFGERCFSVTGTGGSEENYPSTANRTRTYHLDKWPYLSRVSCSLVVEHLAPVVQKLDSAVHWINHYPIALSGGQRCPLDKSLSNPMLSSGQRCLLDKSLSNCAIQWIVLSTLQTTGIGTSNQQVIGSTPVESTRVFPSELPVSLS